MSKNLLEPGSPIRKVWKPELYKIQLEAPTPKAIIRKVEVPDSPTHYGCEYHGVIDHKQSEIILEPTTDGSYIVRKSPGSNSFYTLSLRFDNKIKHFKIYYKLDLGHYLKEDSKRFDTINDLVADGLVDFYMQKHAAPIIKEMLTQNRSCYQQSPYMTLNRRKLRALSNGLRKSQKCELFDLTEAIHSNIIIDDSKDKQDISIGQQDDSDVLPVVYEKPHKFKVHTFKGLNWCELCANFLWGFTAQGVKCEDCGFQAHNKCSELVPAKCVPDLKKLRGVFGIDLTTVITAHQCVVPFVIKRCVEEVESRGMLQEGIYRVSGFADEIEALKLALDKDGEKTDMSEAAYSNVNVVAGVLKLYLRLLPVPLITFQAYPDLITSIRHKTPGEQVIAMREALKKLPQSHYNALKFMIEHLNRVASHHAVNKMTEHNLATVFAPTLIATTPHITDLSQEIYLLTQLITNCHVIFL